MSPFHDTLIALHADLDGSLPKAALSSLIVS